MLTALAHDFRNTDKSLDLDIARTAEPQSAETRLSQVAIHMKPAAAFDIGNSPTTSISPSITYETHPLFNAILYLTMRFSSIAISAALMCLVQAHPGHDLSDEILERRNFVNSVRRNDLSHCADKLRARGVEDRGIARRSAAIKQARSFKGLSKRDVDEVLSQSHDESDTGYTENTDASKLFSGNASCVLTPEVTQGPYCKNHHPDCAAYILITARCRRRIRSEGHYR